MQTSLPIFDPSVVSNFCENKILNESWLSHFHFDNWSFVFELALFCTSKFQFLTEVYNPRFWCRFKSRSTSWTNQQLAVKTTLLRDRLMDCRSFARKTLMNLGNLKHSFWCEFATELFFFLRNLLLADLKLTWFYCHCAVWAHPGKQYFIRFFLECLNCEIVDVIFLISELPFRKLLLHWCLIYVRLFSNVVFGLIQDFKSTVELRSHDYNHFCCKLHEVRHFDRDFGSEALFHIMVLGSPRLEQHMIDLT